MGQESKTRLTTVLLLLTVFGTGVLVGFAADAGGTAQAAEAEPEEAVVSDNTTSSDEEPRRRRIYEQVEPNELQLDLIDSIVTVYRARTNALDEEMRSQLNAGFREILLETRDAIKGVLTAEQAAEYQQLLDESDARRAARENEDERD